jgi:hypothetical protein
VQRVLVLGGYGAFGGLAAERLARVPGIEVIVAGRSAAKARATAARLANQARARVRGVGLDARELGAPTLAALRPAVLINATGPYQQQDYRVARAAIAAGVHYVDLADARAFVTGIAALDPEARRAGVLVVSGASSVPAIPGAVLEAYGGQLARLDAVETIISPANSFDPGVGTTRSILGTIGRPLGARAGTIPGAPLRASGRDVLPAHYPGLRDVAVYAALEVGALHLGLWGFSWLVRAGLLRNPERLAAPLLRLKRRLAFLGTDRGGMVVTLIGRDAEDRPQRLTWSLIAASGHGPYIPATPSALLAKQLLAGTLAARGAMPCVGLLPLDALLAEIADLDIVAGVAGAA